MQTVKELQIQIAFKLVFFFFLRKILELSLSITFQTSGKICSCPFCLLQNLIPLFLNPTVSSVYLLCSALRNSHSQDF